MKGVSLVMPGKPSQGMVRHPRRRIDLMKIFMAWVVRKCRFQMEAAVRMGGVGKRVEEYDTAVRLLTNVGRC